MIQPGVKFNYIHTREGLHYPFMNWRKIFGTQKYMLLITFEIYRSIYIYVFSETMQNTLYDQIYKIFFFFLGSLDN